MFKKKTPPEYGQSGGPMMVACAFRLALLFASLLFLLLFL